MKTIKLIANKHFQVEMIHNKSGSYVVRYETGLGECFMPQTNEYEMASAMFDFKYEQLNIIYSKVTQDVVKLN